MIQARLPLTACVIALVFTIVTAWHWMTDPAIVGPLVMQAEPVQGKMTPEQRLEWLKERNRHNEFNREHPGPLQQFFGGLYANTLGPLMTIMGLVKAVPYVIGAIAVLICVALLAGIWRSIRG